MAGLRCFLPDEDADEGTGEEDGRRGRMTWPAGRGGGNAIDGDGWRRIKEDAVREAWREVEGRDDEL